MKNKQGMFKRTIHYIEWDLISIEYIFPIKEDFKFILQCSLELAKSSSHAQ